MPPTTAQQELLSPSEWKVFSVLTRRNPLTSTEVIQELSRLDTDFSLNPATVRTFLKRLQDKDYLTAEPLADQEPQYRGRELQYRPSVPFDLALRRHVHRFLDQFALGGQADLEIVRDVVAERLSESSSS
jgi:predicted transcriptional regulator